MWVQRIFRSRIEWCARRVNFRWQSTLTGTEEHNERANAYPAYEFKEGENRLAKLHLQTLPQYHSTLFDPSTLASNDKWNTFNPLVQQLKEGAGNPENPLIEDTPSGLISSIIAEMSNLSDEELKAVMFSLLSYRRPFPKPESAYKHLWEAIDGQCTARFNGWSIDELLTVDDLFFQMNSVSLTQFHWHVIKKLFRKCSKLTKEQYIRLMFCLNIGRRIPKTISLYELEHKLHMTIDELTAEEASIVAMGFFKTETKIRDHAVVKKLLEKAIRSSNTLSPSFIASICKLARFCSKPSNTATTYELQDAFYKELHRLDLAESVHLALVGTNAQVKHTLLLEAVRDKIESNLDKARLKELERILLALTMFNIECDSLCHKAIELIRTPPDSRQGEITAYGRCLPSIVHYSTIRNIIPADLISKILGQDFLKTYYDKNRYKYQREMLCLDFTAALECPGYTGNRFTAKERDSVTKFNMLYINPAGKDKLTEFESGLQSVCRLLQDILGGEKFTYICTVLPQFHTAEIVFCLDENNKPVPIPDSFRQLPNYAVKWVPGDDPGMKSVTFNLIRYCHRSVCEFGQSVLLGQAVLQNRQLEKMGYKLHLVYEGDWNAVKSDDTKRTNLIHDLIFHSQLPFSKLAHNIVKT